VESDLHPLVFFLQQAPVLEKLTLQIGQVYDYMFYHSSYCCPVEDLKLLFTMFLILVTVMIDPPVNWVESEGSYNQHGQSFLSKKLKVAEVVYEEFDKRVEAISRILKAYGMHLQHIQQTKRPSERKLTVSTIIASCYPIHP
jgi:hypothetical protein